MKKTALIAGAATALLGACMHDPYHPANAPGPNAPVVTAPNAVGPAASTIPGTTAPVTVVRPFRPGWGLVESVAIVRGAPVSASAGASTLGVYRVGVRMDDGTVQVFDVDRNLQVGERVELTADGRVIRGPVS